MSDYQRMREIGDLIRTQDNRITAHPVFVVEQKKRVYIGDAFQGDEEYEWHNNDDDYCLADKDEVEALDEKLEENYGDMDEMGGWVKTYYVEVWEFTTCCFTEDGCSEYLKINKHNLREPRIYVYSAYRNQEWQDISKHLTEL